MTTEVKSFEKPVFEFRAEDFTTFSGKDLTGDLAESGVRLKEMTITHDLLQKSVGARVMNLSLTETKTRTLPSPKMIIATAVLAGALGVVIKHPEVVSWFVEQVKSLGSVFGLATIPLVGMITGGGNKDGKIPLLKGGFERFFNFEEYRLALVDLIENPRELRSISFQGTSPISGNADVLHSTGKIGEESFMTLTCRGGTENFLGQLRAGKSWADMAPRHFSEEIKGYFLLLRYGEYDTYNEIQLWLHTTDRSTVELIHQQLIDELKRTDSIEQAIDWLIHRSPWDSSLFEVMNQSDFPPEKGMPLEERADLYDRNATEIDKIIEISKKIGASPAFIRGLQEDVQESRSEAEDLRAEAYKIN